MRTRPCISFASRLILAATALRKFLSEALIIFVLLLPVRCPCAAQVLGQALRLGSRKRRRVGYATSRYHSS